jgi:hypothetical protein
MKEKTAAQRIVWWNRRLTKAERTVADLRANRDAAIREAVAAGGTYREVGEVAGITYAGVAKIVKAEKNSA